MTIQIYTKEEIDRLVAEIADYKELLEGERRVVGKREGHIGRLEVALVRCVNEIEENLEFEGSLLSFQKAARLGQEALNSG